MQSTRRQSCSVPSHPSVPTWIRLSWPNPWPDPRGDLKQQNYLDFGDSGPNKYAAFFFSPSPYTQGEKKKKRIKGHFPKVFQCFVWVFPPDLHLLQLCCTSVHSSHVKLDFGCPCERCLGTNTKKSPFPHCLPPSSASSSRKNRWKWPGWIPKLGMFSGVTHWQKTENKCI